MADHRGEALTDDAPSLDASSTDEALTDDAPSLDASSTDEALLRAFEPVVRLTAGELFLPTSVEGYVAQASLWADGPDGQATRLVATGELTVERLVEETDTHPTQPLSLRFVEQPLGRRAYKAWWRRPDRPRFRSASRFAQVGMTARLVDALFRLGLLLRGRVPGGWAAAAEVAYRTKLDVDHHPYYGHVTRQGGYIALQYWWFYAMNDWRSTFSGANDHEADWEQAIVFLAVEDDGRVRPAWVAMSSHDEVGADLRRRWDDPDLVRVGDHPVVHAAAGSHSCNVVPGDYITAIVPSGWLRRVFDVMQGVARLLAPWSRGEIRQGLGIPFIDAARGEGEQIGPGCPRAWSPVVITDDTPWVSAFRGLWGLDTRDRFGGERAPAGPRYERDGRVRQSWADPMGWAALHGVPSTLTQRRHDLEQRVVAVDAELAALGESLRSLRAEVSSAEAEHRSLRDRPGLATVAEARRLDAVAAAQRVATAVAARSALQLERAAHQDTLARPFTADPPQAHLTHRALPIGAESDSRTRFLQVWATISTPLLFVVAAWLLLDHRLGVVVGAAGFMVAFLAVEAIARRRLVSFVVSLLLVALAVLASYVVISGFFEQWQTILAAALAAAGVAVLFGNLRDIRRR